MAAAERDGGGGAGGGARRGGFLVGVGGGERFRAEVSSARCLGRGRPIHHTTVKP